MHKETCRPANTKFRRGGCGFQEQPGRCPAVAWNDWLGTHYGLYVPSPDSSTLEWNLPTTVFIPFFSLFAPDSSGTPGTILASPTFGLSEKGSSFLLPLKERASFLPDLLGDYVLCLRQVGLKSVDKTLYNIYNNTE